VAKRWLGFPILASYLQNYLLLRKSIFGLRARCAKSKKNPQRIPEDTPAVFLTPLPCLPSSLAFLATKLILQVALVFLSILLFFAFFSSLRTVPDWLPLLFVSVLLLGCALPVFLSIQISLFTLGFGLILLPFAGPGILPSFLLGSSLGFWYKRRILCLDSKTFCEFQWGLFCLILSLTLGVIHTAIVDLDTFILVSTLKAGGLRGIWHYLASNFVPTHQSLLALSILIVVSFLSVQIHIYAKLTQIAKAEILLRWFLRGSSAAALPCALIAFLQKINFHPLANYNLSPFWIYLERVAGTFSDPNAAGVMAGLLLPLLLSSHLGQSRGERLLHCVSALMFGLVALLSGSRTFILAISLLLLWKAVQWVRSGDKLRRWASVCVLALCLSIGLLLQEPGLNREVRERSVFPSISRAVETLSRERVNDMFYSRILFARLAFQVWESNPILGVGLGRFYVLQDEAASALDLKLGGWRDNANNFYLDQLAEMGLVGMFLLFCSLCAFCLECRGAFSRHKTCDEYSDPGNTSKGFCVPILSLSYDVSRVLVLFLVLLITGPHTNFVEVQAFSLCLLGLGCACRCEAQQERSTARLRIWLVVAFVFFCSLLLMREHPAQAHRGFYLPEQSQGRTVVWTSGQATLELCRKGQGSFRPLKFRSLHAVISNESPVNVSMDVYAGDAMLYHESLRLTDNNWAEVNLDSIKGSDRVQVRMSISPIWSPSTGGSSQDARWLGVMVEWPEDVCKYTHHE